MYLNKRLGQYSLINKEKIKEIIDALEIEDNDTIVEIGSGQGELTRELIKCPGVIVIAIEKDRYLVQKLKENFQTNPLPSGDLPKGDNNQNPKPEIIQGDALELLPELTKNHKLKTKTYKIVGNIPYYITGQLLRVIGELTFKPCLVVLTLQKEVAERLCAHPLRRRASSADPGFAGDSSKARVASVTKAEQGYGGQAKIHPTHKKCSMCGMNLLAASVQFWAEPEIIDYIPKEDFKPKPKVDSAIIRLRIKNYESGITEKYYKLIKILFKQPRKTVLNNLGIIQKKEEIIKKLQKIGVDPNGRPQDLNIKIIEKLSLML